jgi:polysaccharide export outer membrane protein
MFQDTKDFEFEDIAINEAAEDYILAPNDLISLNIYTNEGARLIEMLAGGSGENGQNMQMQMNQSTGGFSFLIEPDGHVDFPVIGRVKMAGFKRKEAETLLVGVFGEYYNDPYIILKVVNNRVIVSPGGGNARVIQLENNNTTVFEALALAGGVPANSDARKIKLIRNTDQGRVVYKMDLSTVKGLDQADMVVQANDIIYVQPRKQLASQLAKEIGPYLSLLSTAILIYTLSVTK